MHVSYRQLPATRLRSAIKYYSIARHTPPCIHDGTVRVFISIIIKVCMSFVLCRTYALGYRSVNSPFFNRVREFNSVLMCYDSSSDVVIIRNKI
ncbi:hypothetical protein L1987_08365 [Smallanthus sonchifolius]|uniref:Uncharacterized protein n=1 Tax=Smallanthus sonchifolius TaxID=185202 RepID=A0ACB9JM80_9ASTR|nr:hypothetical protein L1987_08365 [Smallanthus sonchifolius]